MTYGDEKYLVDNITGWMVNNLFNILEMGKIFRTVRVKFELQYLVKITIFYAL